MNYKRIFKRETKVIVYVVIALTIVLIGSSYALVFQVKNNNANQVVQAGGLEVTYSTTNTISSNSCLVPKADDETSGGCSFEFTVTNKGNLPSAYTVSISNITVSGKTLMDWKYIKYTLTRKLGTTTSTVASNKLLSSVPTTNSKRVLDTNSLALSQAVTYTFKFWIIDDAPPSVIKQYVSLNINVDNTVDEAKAATVSLSAMSGQKGLFEIKDISPKISTYSNNTTTTDEKKEYRYTGSNPDNYVYFNCQNVANLETCEKWRILGVYNVPFNNTIETRLKIVNMDSNITKAWDSTSNKYDASAIKKYLNEEYFNSLSESARNFVTNAQYTTNVVTDKNIMAKDLLVNEQESDDKISTRVGLMSLSDYALASGEEITLENTEQLNASWLHKGANEWLINPNADNQVYAINADGTIGTSLPSEEKLIRPVVYLNSDVTFVSGSGTFDDPYILK